MGEERMTSLKPMRSSLGDAFGEETITDPGLGLNVLPRTFGFEFAAKLADKDAQILRLVRRLASPYGRQQARDG